MQTASRPLRLQIRLLPSSPRRVIRMGTMGLVMIRRMATEI